MRAPLILLLALALPIAGCVTQPAKGVAKWSPLPASPMELAEIARIEAIGHEIYRQDQLAWHATDALAAGGNARPETKGTNGWVITNLPHAAQVTFIIDDGIGLRVFADVVMPNDGEPQISLSPRVLSKTEVAMFRARETAIRSANNVCGGTLNSAILPADSGEWDVYVLAATTQPHVVPMGGHSRVRVSADGTLVRAIEPYSKTCLNMDDSGKNLAALMATHIVSDLPAPTHVFLSLTYPMPIMLATRTHLWRIERGNVLALTR